MRKPNRTHELQFDRPITRWDEGIPLGNGLTGLLIWGDGNPLRLSLDRGDLWDKRVADEILAEDFTYSELIRLVREGKHDDVKRRFDRFYTKPTPTKIPAGRLEIDYGRACDQANMRLSLYSATAELKLMFDGRYSRIYAYVHATKGFGRMSIRGDAAQPVVRVCGPDYSGSGGGEGVSAGSLALLGYPPAEIHEEGALSWFLQRTREDLEYAVVLAKRRIAQSLEIAYTVAANHDGPHWLEQAKETAARAVGRPFHWAGTEHRRWWAAYWAKSEIDLPDKEFEKQWYLTNYLFGSCSREGVPPMPLQGVWTADDGALPPWKGDYHSDLNTQLSYWHYMKANHLPEGKSFVDFLWALVPRGREFARKFYDAPGLCMPSVMSIDGQALGGWVQYSICLTSQAWLCQAFDHYWRYSGDELFLRDRAYPYLKESAECISRWLAPGPDGKPRLPLSSSPEIYGNSPQAWLTPNSNFDLALLIYLFRALEQMADSLGNGEGARWRELRERLPDLAIGGNDVLMLSPDESLDESHRHHSHAIAIFPLDIVSAESQKAVIDATVARLEELGTALWVGYSFPWMACFYARQGNGEGAAYQLKLFWESFCSQNGFHLNGDFKNHGVCAAQYRPFTLEGNMAAAAALQEMLLRTTDGVIHVFPAIPDSWREKGVSFRDLRGEGAVLVSAEIAAGQLTVSLRAEKTGRFVLYNTFGSDRLLIEDQSGSRVEECPQGDHLPIRLAEGQTCLIRAG
ncbi:MAG: hypothetical protein Q7T82_16290 [Armatimonadota bacterium]|nr:hypothetical protein [Armatimonadota bacterium]